MIKLPNGISGHFGRNVDIAPVLLSRYEKGEGFIPSEVDIRLSGVRNFKDTPDLVNTYWDTITQSATKGETVKVILPYETGSRKLTISAYFGIKLFNSEEGKRLVNSGVNLDIDGRWKKYCNWNEGDGVYIRQRNEWFVEEDRALIGLDKDMTEEQAMKCPILLTKLGHPDYVDPKFWMFKGEKNKSIEGVQKLIRDTFELGKQEYGYDVMMGQYLSDVSEKGVLKEWYVHELGDGAWSNARSDLDGLCGRLAFYSN